MTASELFQAGRLRDAVDTQVGKVKSAPADRRARFFLFELFLFTGELDRARKQLDVLTYDDPKHTAAVEQYRFALDAEAKRRSVFAGTAQPQWLGGVGEHVGKRLEAMTALARGEHAAARTLLDEANANVPTLTGELDGKPFEGLYDADERFGTVLEVFGTGGIYSWVPLESVRSITLTPPSAPRDVVFRPAHLELIDGVTGDVLLPGLYPGTADSPDDAIRLGRATEWVESSGVTRGVGGKLFITGGGSHPIASVSTVVIADSPL